VSRGALSATGIFPFMLHFPDEFAKLRLSFRRYRATRARGVR
jgi:hypothetical protein